MDVPLRTPPLYTPADNFTNCKFNRSNDPTPYLPTDIFVVSGHLSNIEGGRFTRVSEVRIHPEYQPSATWRNDVAVLKLTTPIPYTATEQPIPLASSNVGVQPCFASGWGRIHVSRQSQTLRCTSLPNHTQLHTPLLSDTIYSQHPSRGLPSQLQWSIQNTMDRETCIQFWPEASIFESTLCAGATRGSGVCSVSTPPYNYTTDTSTLHAGT